MHKRLPFAVAAIAGFLFLSQAAYAQNTSPYWSLAGNSNASATSKLGTTNNFPLRLYTNNVERIRILSTNGNVGVGTLSPTERLHINTPAATNALRVQVNGNTKLFVHSNGGTAIGGNITPPANGLYVNGTVGIGTAAPVAGYKVHVAGRGLFTTGLQVNDGTINVINTTGGDAIVATSTSSGATAISANGDVIGVAASGNIWAVYGGSNDGVGVHGQSNSFTGVGGLSTDGVGAAGESSTSDGVRGMSNTGTGVHGTSESGYGGNFESSNSWGLRASTETGFYAGVFYGNVWTSGSYITSDKNLKQNVQEFNDAMSILGKLKPRYYEFKSDPKLKFLHLEKGSHYGLLAQDVEEVLPNLVSTSDHQVPVAKKQSPVLKYIPDGVPQKPAAELKAIETPETVSLKAVNYVELIPIMIKGMQEQAAVIEKQNERLALQDQKIEELKLLVNKLAGNLKGTTAVITGTLSQATPNPARSSTRISYAVPSNSRAQLILTDGSGKTVKAVGLNASGFINLDTVGLSSGVYNYSLVIDGKITETKKLTVAR